MKEKILIVFVICFTLFACNSGKDEMRSKEVGHTLFKLLDSSQTGVSFVNAIENQKNFNIFKYRNFYNGGGVAIGDINNDGLPDIYLTGNMEANKLYLNKGNFKFEDITIKAGVAGNKPWSTGVTMADVNADGYLDIYVSNAGNLEGNNHDNDLYINNGDLTFTEKAHDFNLAKTGFSTHASFFDYDKDGDLDAYILNNSNIPVSSLGYAEQREVRAQDWEGVPHIFRGVGDMLLRNDDGKFVDVSEDAGIYGSLIGFGLGVLVTDINNDLYPDIYVSNDFYERDYLYINNQDGTFSERIKDWVSHLSLSAMGIDIADINNDGHNDIFITDMLPEPEQRVKSVMEFEGYNVFNLKQSKDFYQQYIQNTLQLNNGNGSFSEIAYYSGVDATDWSWAGLMFDMDNDGLKDIFVTNGINHDLTDLDFVDFFANEIIQKMALTGRKESIDSIIAKMPIKPQPNYAYRNNGDITFDNANADWGFELPTMSNGAAYGDLDNDGDLDLVINNVNTPAFIYENQTNSQLTENNFIKIKFNGMGKNPFGVGSLAKLYYEDNIVNQELIPSRGFQSSMDYTMTIGLGKAQKLDSIRVVWPDNQTQLLTEIPVNQEIAFNQSEADAVYQVPYQNGKETLLNELDNSNLLAHKENYYSDFDYEGLIYKKISQEGPAMAIGDVNGDGHEDVFVGGAKSGERWIYFHLGNGKFDNGTKVSAKSNWGDDTAAAFFDADNDGDLDLAIGISGNEVGQQQKYRTELLINDGKGTFSDSGKVLPSTFKNISVIAPNDYDGDGDTDIFIGSRSTVGIYGVSPDHLLLENRGDLEFVDATERSGYDLKDAGMVSDAIWVDINGDSQEDLITVSEWGTPKIYEKSGRRILKVESSLDSLSGWWNTVEAADLDNDGDLDLVLGNHGENLHYGPRYDAPMRMWINDFDNNGTIEQIVTLHENGGDYPIHQKKELTEQLVSLKKQNLKASDYARRTIHELFPKEVLDKSVVKESVVSSSVLAINEGNGNFTIKKLPPMTQLSCVCDISCTDVNGDGHLDLVMAGNDFEYKPQFSRLDANYGNVLLGNGKLDFEWQHYDKSGFFIRNEVKHLKELKDKAGNRYLIAAINNDKPKIFAINE